MLKPCLVCAQPTNASTCPACTRTTRRQTERNRVRNRPWSTRGYDALYRRNRKVILAGNPRCVRCGNHADTADHIVPLAKGGTNDLRNLQPMCKSCNSAKQDT